MGISAKIHQSVCCTTNRKHACVQMSVMKSSMAASSERSSMMLQSTRLRSLSTKLIPANSTLNMIVMKLLLTIENMIPKVHSHTGPTDMVRPCQVGLVDHPQEVVPVPRIAHVPRVEKYVTVMPETK